MLQFLIQRLLFALLTLALVLVIVFLAGEALPGDTCTVFLGRDTNVERLLKCRTDLGLDRPAWVRFGRWLGHLFQGDFGISLTRGEPINSLLAIRLRNTALLGGMAALIGIPLALLLGIIAGLQRDKPADVLISTIAIGAMTLPEFVTATVLIYFFSISLRWLPAITMVATDASISELLPNIILPILTLALIMVAYILRMVRTSVIEVMKSDYVQMARLKGVSYWRMVWRHALPNAMLPTINVIALTVAWLMGGVVIIESIFNYPGVGTLMVTAILARDLPVVQSIALVLAVIYIGMNLLADLLTLLLNPKLRTARTS